MEKYIFNREKKPASVYTAGQNKRYLQKIGLPELEKNSYEYAQIHQDCLLELKEKEDFIIRDRDGSSLVDLRPFYYIRENAAAPESVNPSLWQAAKANTTVGVYGIIGKDVLQVRGVGVNTTLIRGKSGWVMVDVPSSEEEAEAGILLAERATGEEIFDNISAVIIGVGITDLYGNPRGGLRAVIGDRNIPIYASNRLGITMTEENTYSNIVNMRKQAFQFGTEKPGPLGYVTSGFANGSPGGSSTYSPTNLIEKEGWIEVDGLKIEVTFTHDIGTPSELNLFFEDYGILWVGECLIGMLHNIYTVRGAKPRNANVWGRHIFDLYTRYGEKAVAVLQSTNWAHKNSKEYPHAVKEYLLNSATAYKWIHDQTLHYASMGYRPEEIAKMIEYPEALAQKMYVRPYYGSVELGAKGIYYSYFGNYDGNPVNLQKQNKQEEAEQFIEYVGSVEKVFEKAFEDYKNNRYQRAMEALDKIMFYDPEYEKARMLYADILEQSAYQAECGTWRNAYLNGAKELRFGPRKKIPKKDAVGQKHFAKTAAGMPDELMLDYIGIALDGQKAGDAHLEFQLNVKGKKEIRSYEVILHQGALLYSRLPEGTIRRNLPQIQVLPGILTKLVTKELDSVKDYIETEHFEILKELETYMENMFEYLDYPVMEKRI